MSIELPPCIRDTWTFLGDAPASCDRWIFSWRQLYKNRSSRKIDSQRLFSREYYFPKTFSPTELSFPGRPIFIQFVPEFKPPAALRTDELPLLLVKVPLRFVLLLLKTLFGFMFAAALNLLILVDVFCGVACLKCLQCELSSFSDLSQLESVWWLESLSMTHIGESDSSIEKLELTSKFWWLLEKQGPDLRRAIWRGRFFGIYCLLGPILFCC